MDFLKDAAEPAATEHTEGKEFVEILPEITRNLAPSKVGALA
ncbi:MAG: hypothetical protein OXG53_16870 [Chloroflexi bacterium]|nr:hypothetical protein [Chloroflexota bacterium]